MSRICTLVIALAGILFCLLPAQGQARVGVGISPASVLDTRNLGGAAFEGYVREQGSQGQNLGGLAGAAVAIENGPQTTTNSQGFFRFENLSPGTKTVTASREGYLAVTRSVTVRSQSTTTEVFALQGLGWGAPQVHNPVSSRGRHLIEGMPGSITFETVVDWNGTPGTVRFRLAGSWQTASLADLDGGRVRATRTIAAPARINTVGEWEIEATNGQGRTTRVRSGVHFYPVSPAIQRWFAGAPGNWGPAGHNRFRQSRSIQTTLWDLSAGQVGTSAGFADHLSLTYDSAAGTFAGSRSISGSYGMSVDASGLTVMGDGTIRGSGSLNSTMRGFDPASLSGTMALDVGGRAGVGAPLSILVDILFPALSPAMTTMRGIPVLGSLIDLVKLEAFLLGAMGGRGHWGQGAGSCWLGADSVDLHGTLGLEAHAIVEAAESFFRLTAGGTATPEVRFCPEWEFQRAIIRGYARAHGYVSLWLVDFDKKWDYGFTMVLGASGKVTEILYHPQGKAGDFRLKPLGDDLLRFGRMNRIPADKSVRLFSHDSLKGSDGAAEQTLLENVMTLASAALMVDESGVWVHFVHHDPDKPWYEATDIGQLVNSDGTWELSRVTDNQSAEFSPATADMGSSITLTAWTRVGGDISEAEGLEDIMPELEIMVAKLDRRTGAWSSPVQLTSNDMVDREPRPVVYGGRAGVIWIQNEGPDAPGNATHGDRLMFAGHEGGGWGAPEILWEDNRGILALDVVSDGEGEAHVLLSVVRHGESKAVEDCQLYSVSTHDGVWQPARQLASENSMNFHPVLLAPGGVAMGVWISDDTLSYSALDPWEPREVYSEYTVANHAASLAGVTMPGGAAVAYNVQMENHVDVVVSFYDALLDQWSLPRQLTNDEDTETGIDLAVDGNDLLVSYVKSAVLREDLELDFDGELHTFHDVPGPGRSDLALLRHTLGHDLAVRPGSLATSPANPVPGNAATLTARVENRGDLAVSDFDVAFYEGDPTLGGSLIDTVRTTGTLVAGAAIDVSVEWDILFGTPSTEIFVIVDPGLLFEDRNRLNNSDSAWTILPDLTVLTGTSDPMTDSEILVQATIGNVGSAPVGAFDVSFRLDDPEGPEIDRTTIPELRSGAQHDTAILWNIDGQGPEGRFATVYAVADPDGAIAEWDETNNSMAITVQVDFRGPEDLEAGDIVRVLLGKEPAFIIFDLNEDGVIDAADILPTLEDAPTPTPTPTPTPSPTPSPTPPPDELEELTIMLPGDVPLVMVPIPAGSFVMGSREDERVRWSHEGPQTHVTLTRDFYMGKYPVTQRQWLALMGSWPLTAPYTPSAEFGLGDDYPAYYISWDDARTFIATLNVHITTTGQGPATMRLPTEAEWEYACRAGTTSRFYFGDSLDCDDQLEDCAAGVLPGNRSDYMWWEGNSGGQTQPVGQKLPNAFGLYDMHGNVGEWCQDRWATALPGGSVVDPTGPSTGSRHVLRGGNWNVLAWHCRSTSRNTLDPSARDVHHGFRVVLVP